MRVVKFLYKSGSNFIRWFDECEAITDRNVVYVTSPKTGKHQHWQSWRCRHDCCCCCREYPTETRRKRRSEIKRWASYSLSSSSSPLSVASLEVWVAVPVCFLKYDMQWEQLSKFKCSFCRCCHINLYIHLCFPLLKSPESWYCPP